MNIERKKHRPPLRGKKCSKLSKTDAAYIAGIIDGEGCVTLSKKKDPSMRLGYGLRPHITVVNTNKKLIQFLKDITNLGVVYSGQDKKKNSKPHFRWQLWSQQARSFLLEILPYLVLKQKQAQLVLDYTERCAAYAGGPLPKSALLYQERACIKMRKLNKRGIN